MPQINSTGPTTINQGTQKSPKVQKHLKQQLEEAQKKIERLESEVSEVEAAS